MEAKAQQRRASTISTCEHLILKRFSATVIVKKYSSFVAAVCVGDIVKMTSASLVGNEDVAAFDSQCEGVISISPYMNHKDIVLQYVAAKYCELRINSEIKFRNIDDKLARKRKSGTMACRQNSGGAS